MYFCFNFPLFPGLQITIAASSILFMLLVEGHNWNKKSSDCYSYVTTICKKVCIEVFDSVEMMDYLILSERLPNAVEHVIFMLVSLNFLLPGLSLYQLSASNFGKKITVKCILLKVLQSMIRLFLIDFPFFFVRLYLFAFYHSFTIFMMKNLFYILLEIRELYIEVLFHLKAARRRKLRAEEIALNSEQTQTDGKRSSSVN